MRMASMPIAVIMQRRTVPHPWADEAWAAVGVVPNRGELPPLQPLSRSEDREYYLVAGLELELYPDENDGYFENCVAPEPKVFVMWRMRDDDVVPPAEPFIVTLSYNEAGRFMDGGERVDPVPMAAAIREWLAAYVAVHYKPEPKKKVKRNDPFAAGAFRRGS